MHHSSVICITGCSSGIGRALASCLAAQGATVYAGMRDLQAAPTLNEARPLQLDVTRPDQIAQAIDTIERQCGRLDVLINNAGVNAASPWELVPPEIARRIFDVNFFGAVEVTKAALPLMRTQGSGHIVMISSLSALVALPTGGLYAASKAALEAFAESLSYEVRPWNIHISIVNPGAYATALDTKAWRPPAAGGPYASLLGSSGGKSTSRPSTAERAAERIIAVVNDTSERLRHPLDDTARRVFHTLNWQTDRDRERIAREVSGLGWWLDGSKAAARPPKP